MTRLQVAVAVVFIASNGVILTGCAGVGCSCGPGETENSFANGSSYCCPKSYPYYCSGNGKCYQTWNDAYFGNTAGCTLPQDRQTCGGSSDSGTCAPNCAKGTHQVGCECVPN